jgi:hypothetical protein
MPTFDTVTRVLPNVEASVRGAVAAASIGYAQSTIAETAECIDWPVHRARVRLAWYAGLTADHLLVAQANLEVAGRLVRAQAVGRTEVEAVDQVACRLRASLRSLARHLDTDGTGRATFSRGEWRSQAPTWSAPALVRHPTQPRRLVRYKSCPLALEDVDAAAFAMDLADYDFYLFTDDGSGQDSLVYRAGPTGYRIAQLQPDHDRDWDTAVPLTVNPLPAPRLTLPQAITCLETTGKPFLFFAGAAAGRGRVLYGRYDGNLGLIIPAW